MLNKILCLCVMFILPITSWAACNQYDATEVSVLQLVKAERVLWQSSAVLAVAVQDDDAESLCFVQEKKNKAKKTRATIELENDLWLVEFNLASQYQLPIQLEAVVASFHVRGQKTLCERQAIRLEAVVNNDFTGCLSAFNGVALRLMSVPLTKEQQQEVKDSKPFWQFEEANDKAKKRMKKR
ncbi:MAG: hypothetical protein KAG18_04400 [Sinobacterium sp.]|nr:hypothetical protein [Sinobacterium sp.]